MKNAEGVTEQCYQVEWNTVCKILRQEQNIDSALIGTRINVHLAAIEKFLSELFLDQ